MRRLLFRPEVEDDLADASRWYEERHPGLGAQLLEAVEEALELVARDPEVWKKRR